MGVRAKAAEMTSEEIIRVLGELWMKYSLHEITLQMVAQNTGVTVMTILRKFGSKEGLFEAAINADTAGIEDVRKEAQAGNIIQAISISPRPSLGDTANKNALPTNAPSKKTVTAKMINILKQVDNKSAIF